MIMNLNDIRNEKSQVDHNMPENKQKKKKRDQQIYDAQDESQKK